jgi:hypothetical protein
VVHGWSVFSKVGVTLLSSLIRQVDQPELVRGGLSGEEPPQIDGELAGNGHDGFDASLLPCCQAISLWSVLPRRRTATGIAQHRQSLFQPVVIGLPAHHPPDHLHEHGSDPRITLFTDAASSSLASAAVIARTESRAERSETASHRLPRRGERRGAARSNSWRPVTDW